MTKDPSDRLGATSTVKVTAAPRLRNGKVATAGVPCLCMGQRPAQHARLALRHARYAGCSGRTDPHPLGEAIPFVLSLSKHERDFPPPTEVFGIIRACLANQERYDIAGVLLLPGLKSLLIDENAYTDSELASLKNLVAAVFRIEHPALPP